MYSEQGGKFNEKKFMSLIIFAISLILGQGITTFASSAAESSVEEYIIEQALKLNHEDDNIGKEFEIVDLKQYNPDVNMTSDDSYISEQAIQAVSVQDDLVKVTTIFPYKIMPNGEWISSFEYSPKQVKDSSNPTTFVDTTITVNTYYSHYFSWDNAQNFYRHKGIEVYWNSDNTTAKVSNMYVIYDSRGDIYRYPECITESLGSTLVQKDFFIRSEVDQDNPVENQIYADLNHSMDQSNVLVCSDYFEDGGLVYLKLTYTVNGNSYTHDRSYYVYGK